MTLQELRREAKEENIQTPLLYDVLTLLSNAKMTVQLELKGPLTDPKKIISIVRDTYKENAVRS